ncbi:outer-membrane receptor for ferric coprogen and ferric-rhodotorulic acid [Pseudomonas koreensis]|uniref:TonB-dependent siderophore receptor n=1 Tax=Pseudomonas koreensis TaxID=198620 RepID=UPI00087BCA4E|nr:TonB-dependent siderophore receptor [Pseudomonas koreensis]KAB0513848.1 TonB-dependent siderophore receptor [Pseudomonas koreensis]NNA63375.1 TonB-dependent siderophore receptor [Pseudomonas koreensis]GGK34568.1 ligand-gated channel [Pseudomonas koreensis]SDE48797.1 outer-membrane receptor for ferric coprogen and ferric-rhodotorulic acid [Pseudomonas koreensis]
MFAPITRSITLTFGLCSAVLSPDLLAETDPETAPQSAAETLELDATSISAEGLGINTENTDSYTTGVMSTATRMNLSIKETPQSVSVVTRQQMDDFKLGTLSEAMSQTTGIVVQHNDSDRVSYSARGYPINNFQIDGMLNTFSYMKSDADTIIYDRIEVVRGATGLTTGAGDPSATINMVRKRPTAQLQALAGVSGGSYDDYYSYVDVGGPLAFDGRLRGRTVLAYRDSQSFRDKYALQREVGYGILEADLTDSTVLAVGYDYQDKQVQGTSWGTVPYWNAEGGKAGLGRSTNMATSWSSWPLRDKTAFATLDQQLAGGWHLKAAYTHRKSDTEGKIYYGGGGFPEADRSGMSANTSHMAGDQSMKAYDFNVSGPYALLGREHELMFGYGEAERRSDDPYTIAGAVPAGYENIRDWKYMGDIDKFPDTVTGLSGFKDYTRQKAGYLATRLSLTDELHAVLGSRYGSWETASATNTYDDKLQLSGVDKTSQQHNDMWTPYAGLLYDLTPQYTVYVSYTDIFNPQTRRDASRRYIDPVVGSNYELGLKGSLLEERLNLSTALFWSKQDNVAERDGSVAPDPVTGEEFFKSGGKGNKVNGFEAEVSGELLNGWNMTAGYTYTHSVNGEKQRTNTAQPLNMFRLSTAYRLPGNWHALTVGGAVNWQSDIYGASNRPVGRGANGRIITERARINQEAYTVVKLMSRYEFDQHLSASLNVDNLFDKKYYDNVGFYNGVYWGDPRTVTLSLDWKL